MSAAPSPGASGTPPPPAADAFGLPNSSAAAADAAAELPCVVAMARLAESEPTVPLPRAAVSARDESTDVPPMSHCTAVLLCHFEPLKGPTEYVARRPCNTLQHLKTVCTLHVVTLCCGSTHGKLETSPRSRTHLTSFGGNSGVCCETVDTLRPVPCSPNPRTPPWRQSARTTVHKHMTVDTPWLHEANMCSLLSMDRVHTSFHICHFTSHPAARVQRDVSTGSHISCRGVECALPAHPKARGMSPSNGSTHRQESHELLLAK